MKSSMAHQNALLHEIKSIPSLKKSMTIHNIYLSARIVSPTELLSQQSDTTDPRVSPTDSEDNNIPRVTSTSSLDSPSALFTSQLKQAIKQNITLAANSNNPSNLETSLKNNSGKIGCGPGSCIIV